MTTAPASSGPGKLVVALIAVGGVLLLTITAVVFLLVGQNSGGSIAAGDQAPLPDASQTPVPAPADDSNGIVAEGQSGAGNGGQSNGGAGGGQAPVDNSVRFTSFTYNPQVACDPTGDDEKPSPSISWSSANAVHVYWTPNSNDANAGNGYEVGASGNQDDMSASKGQYERYEFPCNHRQYFDTTITLVGADGQTVSKHVTFTDINWNTGGDDDEDY